MLSITRMGDYHKNDEHEVTARKIKCFSGSEIILDTASEYGLRCELLTLPSWSGFCVVKVFAKKSDFRRAQFSWLQKMIQARHETEIEL